MLNIFNTRVNNLQVLSVSRLFMCFKHSSLWQRLQLALYIDNIIVQQPTILEMGVFFFSLSILFMTASWQFVGLLLFVISPLTTQPLFTNNRLLGLYLNAVSSLV